MPTTQEVFDAIEETMFETSPKEALENRSNTLDNSDAVIFKSPEACAVNGYDAQACDEAFASAKELAVGLTLDIECHEGNEISGTVVTETPTDFKVEFNDYIGKIKGAFGKAVVTGTCPEVIVNAIEVGANDLNNPVPLNEIKDNLFRRPDGQCFAIGDNNEAQPAVCPPIK